MFDKNNPCCKETNEKLELIHQELEKANDWLDLIYHRLAQQVSDFQLRQIEKGELMPIVGTVVGASSTFQETPVPATNFVPLQSGPVFTVDDTLVTLSASPDGDPTKVVATVAATDTGAVYNITVSGVNGLGTTVSHTFAVPILPLPPPPPQQISDFSLNQLS